MTRTLSEVATEASTCTKCRLAEGRTQVVFGVGDPNADLMFVGEAPGFHEDKQGEPFVGAAGQLLTRMLVEIGLARDDVWICNVLKCRPPGNRDPLEDEIESCTPWLVEQISLIQPRVIVTLGNFATKYVLQTQQGITRMRGATYPWHGRTVIPTFHPAAILHGGGERSPQFALLREDFALIKVTLETQPSHSDVSSDDVVLLPDLPPAPGSSAAAPGSIARPVFDRQSGALDAEPDDEQMELF
jgi:uracil-DNA glycosylase family 4